MASVRIANLGFKPLGRMHIRKDVPGSNRSSRHVGLWPFRPRSDASTLARLQKAYTDALDAVDKIEQHKDNAKASGKLTPEGITADTLQFATTQLASMLHHGRQAIDAARDEVLEKRAKLTLQPVGKTDVAGALRRQEMRAWLRQMPNQERSAYISDLERRHSRAIEAGTGMIEIENENCTIIQPCRHGPPILTAVNRGQI